ncbi:MAG: helix-turn-helix transcriptional regulator [Bacillota bacterium]
MTLGYKIKHIRHFRNMTQKELGLALGFPERSAETRLYQYENNLKTPRMNVILSMAKALYVSPLALLPDSDNKVISIIENLFWNEEELFLLQKDQSHKCPINIVYEQASNRHNRSRLIDTPLEEFIDQYMTTFSKKDIQYTDEILIYCTVEIFNTVKEFASQNLIDRSVFTEWKLTWPYNQPFRIMIQNVNPDIYETGNPYTFEYILNLYTLENNIRPYLQTIEIDYLFKNKFGIWEKK